MLSNKIAASSNSVVKNFQPHELCDDIICHILHADAVKRRKAADNCCDDGMVFGFIFCDVRTLA